jgi:hypothetical protein
MRCGADGESAHEQSHRAAISEVDAEQSGHQGAKQ